MKQYVKNNKEFFKSVDVDTGMVIGAFMNSSSIMNGMRNRDEGGKIDMCKAMEDWAAEERLEGRLEGIEDNLVNQICKKLAKGKDIVQIADEIEETVEKVKELMKKHKL